MKNKFEYFFFLKKKTKEAGLPCGNYSICSQCTDPQLTQENSCVWCHDETGFFFENFIFKLLFIFIFNRWFLST